MLVNCLDLRRVGRVCSQTFELRSREGAAREPDPLAVLDEHRDRVDEVRVSKYWFVDPRDGHESVQRYVLEADGRYRARAADAAGRLRSSVLPGRWLDATWLTTEELPSVVSPAIAMAGETPGG